MAGRPMDSLAATAGAAASLLFSAKSPPEASVLLLPLSGAAARLLRRVLLLLLHSFFCLFFLLLSLLVPSSLTTSPSHSKSSPDSTCVSRALSHVLTVLSRVPVASRKYELVRSLAERLIDENLRFNGELNRTVLSEAFARTLSRLEAAVAADRGMEVVVGKVKAGIRRWWPVVDEEEAVSGAVAEKLAAELLWFGQKMAECGAAGEAVVRWAAVERLGRRALAAEPRLQVALVRVAVFLFKHANSEQIEEVEGEEDGEIRIADPCFALLKSWLPLLCRASNGTDTPLLNSREKAEMVRVLEELIEKLSWEQKEEVLALWLHHFASCPDSDWPNLESYYARWYSESRKLLLK